MHPKALNADFLCKLTGCKSLKTIKILDLSAHNLSCLDATLLNQLTSLEDLDLSDNELTEIPSNISLSHLTCLDVSDNLLSSVDFVTQFPRLTTLYLTRNPSLEVSDKYIAAVLCASLVNVELGGNCKGNIQRTTGLIREKLALNVQGVWRALYEDLYPNGIPLDKLDSVQQQFLMQLQGEILNTVLVSVDEVKFQQFLIEKLAKEIVYNSADQLFSQSKRKRYANSAYKDLDDNNSSANSTPSTTPAMNACKRRRLHSPEYELSPDKQQERTPEKSSVSPHKRTPGKHKSSATPKTVTVKRLPDSAIDWRNLQEEIRLPPLPDYDPVYFLRCHSEVNDPADCDTKVWKCAFEPNPYNTDESTNILASCGGDCICLIDTHTGHVMKRYKDNTGFQNFFILAWTTVMMPTNSGTVPTNLLAVSGDPGGITLLHPSQLVAYACLEKHKKYVNCLLFHPTNPTRLFSGGSDGEIILWDIGVPDFVKYTTDYRCLLTVHAPQNEIVNMLYDETRHLLIATCDKAMHVWNLENMDKVKHTKTPSLKLVLPHINEDDIVDALAQLKNKNIVCKSAEDGAIYLWSLKQNLPSKLRYGVGESLRISPLARFKYADTDQPYINICIRNNMMIAGDAEGQLWMYNIAELEKTMPHNHPLLIPSRILAWPVLDSVKNKMPDLQEKPQMLIMNTVDVSSDGATLACGTDNNLLCIWKRKTKAQRR